MVIQFPQNSNVAGNNLFSLPHSPLNNFIVGKNLSLPQKPHFFASKNRRFPAHSGQNRFHHSTFSLHSTNTAMSPHRCAPRVRPETLGPTAWLPRSVSLLTAQAGSIQKLTFEKDAPGYDIADDPVDSNDLHATIFNQMRIDRTKLTYRFQGRDFRLTDVSGNVVRKLIS
jgi:hypothetical protein